MSADEWAALATHEIFHVFQRALHPGRSGNEADYFTYPVDDTTALALRRVETLVGAALAESRWWTVHRSARGAPANTLCSLACGG